MNNTYTLEDKYQYIKKHVLSYKDIDAFELIKSIMKCDFINMHGPEHHYLDGACLLVCLHNVGVKFELESSLDELKNRAMKMPGAMCGYWGICGSVSSLGAIFSIIDKTGPLSNDLSYKKHMEFTSKVIARMSVIGGPRCCKRNAFISLNEAIKFSNEYYKVDLPISSITCEFSKNNAQCIKERCPFHQN